MRRLVIIATMAIVAATQSCRTQSSASKEQAKKQTESHIQTAAKHYGETVGRLIRFAEVDSPSIIVHTQVDSSTNTTVLITARRIKAGDSLALAAKSTFEATTTNNSKANVDKTYDDSKQIRPHLTWPMGLIAIVCLATLYHFFTSVYKKRK